jgi:hypothetical protein
MLTQAREEIRAARALAAARGEMDVVQRLDQALAVMEPERLLTPAQAAEFLGIRSSTIVQILARLEGLHTVQRNQQMLIPLSELERIQDSKRLQDIRASDRIHAEAEMLGAPDGLTQEELDILEEDRPGRLPWLRPRELA